MIGSSSSYQVIKDRLVQNSLVICFLVIAISASSGAGQTNVFKSSTPPATTIKKNFLKDAPLSATEMSQVLSLAHQCGIHDVAEIGTYYALPSSIKVISVKSTDRVDGQNTSFDTVSINKIGWGDSGPENNAKRIGNFWVDTPGRYTTLLRSYEYGKKTVQIAIGDGIEIAFADKVIPLIAAKKVRFDHDSIRREFEELGNSKPQGIYQSYPDKKGYEMRFSEPTLRALMFRVDKGRVVITGITEINI